MKRISSHEAKHIALTYLMGFVTSAMNDDCDFYEEIPESYILDKDKLESILMERLGIYESEGRLLEYFTMIDDIRKEKLREEKMILYHGLEDAMHSMSHYADSVDEGEMKELKSINKLYFDPTDGNIAFLINIAKAYFPNGTYDNAAISGVNFFNRFRKLLRAHKDEYLNGKSSQWAKTQGHYDYIKLVLDKDSDNK
jgi:hypothetical protein